MSGALGFGAAAEAVAIGSTITAGGGLLQGFGLGAFGALGSVSFALLGSPSAIARRRRSCYAKLPILTERPVLQWVYDDLEQLALRITLHEMWLGSGGPDAALAVLDQQRLSHQAAALVFGGQTTPAGQYVVTELTATDRWRYAGVSQWIEVKMSLTEWVPPSSLATSTGQPPTPPVGVIGTPGAFAALYIGGAMLGLPLPTLGFASTAAALITRAGAP